MVKTTLLYKFVGNKNKEFVFIVENKYFTKIEWGDGTSQIITDPLTHSYHKYTSSSIYTVTFTSDNPIPYIWFTSPLITNGYGYIINCPNSVNVNDNIKLNHTFNEQGYASDRIKKRKYQTIYSNLKSINPLLNEIPNTYRSYESLNNIQRGYLYCKFNSIYAFQ